MMLIDKEEALTAIADEIRALHNEDAIVVGERIEEIGLRTAFDIIKRLPTVEPKKVYIANITVSEEQIREAIEKAKSEIIQVLPSAQTETHEERTETHACDCISRQNAIDAIEEITWYHQNRNKDMVSGANSSEHQAWYKANDVYKVLESVPSAQPEIIRCKDCKYASPNGKYGCKAYHFKLYETHAMFADDYCSRAERKEE